MSQHFTLPIEIDGHIFQTLSECARHYGLTPACLYARVEDHKWLLELLGITNVVGDPVVAIQCGLEKWKQERTQSPHIRYGLRWVWSNTAGGSPDDKSGANRVSPVGTNQDFYRASPTTNDEQGFRAVYVDPKSKRRNPETLLSKTVFNTWHEAAALCEAHDLLQRHGEDCP